MPAVALSADPAALTADRPPAQPEAKKSGDCVGFFFFRFGLRVDIGSIIDRGGGPASFGFFRRSLGSQQLGDVGLRFGMTCGASMVRRLRDLEKRTRAPR